MEKNNDNLLMGAQSTLKDEMNKLQRKRVRDTVSYVSIWKGGLMKTFYLGVEVFYFLIMKVRENKHVSCFLS